MATAVAKTESQGLKFYNKFVSWCEKGGQTPGPALFQTWDIEHNNSHVQELFGGKSEIYRAGLTALYTRYFYSYASIRFTAPDGKGSISMQPYRKSGPGVGEIGDITDPKLDAASKEYMIGRAVADLKNAAQRLKLLRMTRAQIIAHIDED